MDQPNFSPYPFARLRRLTAREAAFESAVARWVAARGLGARTAQLVGGPVQLALVGGAGRLDPDAALAEVRLAGASFVVAAPARSVRGIAQRVLGGPAELDAPRPLAAAEQAIWALVVAAAVTDAGVAADVWPLAELPAQAGRALEIAVTGALTTTVVVLCPTEIEVRVPPPRALPGWTFDVRVRVAHCALPREAVGRLAVRDVVTVERDLSLILGDGTIGLTAAHGAVEAAVATGYIWRPMALPDDAHLELSVELGTTRLSLRQLSDLAVGQIVPLGRPLAGPFEIRAGGRQVGLGELVDVDGELGVRIVSLSQE